MIAEANQYKSEGNSFFATGKYDEAISKYEDALLACPERNTQDRAVFFANIAACQMKQVSSSSDPDSSEAMHSHISFNCRENLLKLKNPVAAH